MALTPRPIVDVLEEGESHPAAPLSPAATNTLIPSAAACCQREFQNWVPEVPEEASHKPKLVVTIGATLLLTMYCAESVTPSLDAVDAETTNFTAALGAGTPAHSASRVASVCSPPLTTPGLEPFMMTVGLFAGSPKALRKDWTSARLILLRATTATLAPVPFTLLV